MLTAVMLAGYDPDYLRISEFHVRREIAAGRVPFVVDATAISGAGVDSYHRPTLSRFGLDYPGHDLRRRMAKLGVDVIDLADYLEGEWYAPLTDKHEAILAVAVRSAVITYFRTDQPKRSRLVRRTSERLLHEGRGVYRGLRALFEARPSMTLAYVPNGRFPHQKMAHLAARDAGLQILHFEKGESANASYLQDHAPQNRFATQGAVEPLLAGKSAREVEQIADTWLSRRAPSVDSSNQFSTLWAASLPEHLRHLASGDQKVAGFFTSSQDEFQFLGAEWERHEWASQYEAFHQVLLRLEAQGYLCYLRVHPNLATKAQDLFVRERAGIRWLAEHHPDLLVIWHDDFANTYSLLDASDAIVVWGSTVGLEASARGLPVWTMATSRYGLVADVREVLSQAQLDEEGIEAWEVDAHAAKRFIAYLMLRDVPMDPEYRSWIPWGRNNRPLGARIAAALAAGGIPSPREAVKSQLDVYRHRSLRSNLRKLRKD